MSLIAGRAVDVVDTALVHEPLPKADVVAGSPATATVEFGEFNGVQLGIWEMTAGTATDVEVDEVFLVISGRARIEFTDRDLPPVDIGAGDIVRLEAGMHTTWTVTETLRKIWIS